MTEPVTAKEETYRKGRILIGCTLAILFILGLVGGIPRLLNDRKIDALASENDPPRVTLMKITSNTELIPLVLPSSAQGWHYTPIWSRVNGYIVRYLVDIGDVVKSGDVLAEIDTPETDELLARAQADLLNSIVERDIAKITSDRWQKLWEKNPEAVSKQEVDQYFANLQSAEALILANEKEVAKFSYQQQFKYIYAPFDGVINKRLIDIGSLVYGSVNGEPQELFQMTQTGTIRFFTDVPQTYYKQITEGIEAEVTIIQLPGKVFKGKVTRYAKALDPTARTLLTQVDVDNQEGLLYAGLYGTVKFLFKPQNANFIIPTSAVIIRSSYPHVAVVDANHIVHMKRVRIGRDYGDSMEITHGLESDQQIVMIPSDSIKDGVKVEIIEK